jgi:hypothetical protein
MITTAEDKEIIRDFRAVVNMTATRLKKWLETDESRAVGFKGDDGGESLGHRSGRRIISLLRKRQADLTSGDLKRMKKVTGYVHRHLAQRPAGDVRETPWRYSLMNWGCDPLVRKRPARR